MDDNIHRLTDREVADLFYGWQAERGTTWIDLIRRVERIAIENAQSALARQRAEDRKKDEGGA